MISYGEPIISRREEFIQELNEIIATIHHDLTGGKENIILKYCPNVPAGQLAREIRKNRGRDLAARVSLSGPHRDDIEFIVNGIDVRHFGSQGQQRTAALSLKLAEIELVKRRIGENPILLLDDVLSELDTGRQTHLLAGLSGVQTIMTCTGLDDFIENSFHIDKRFHVEKGTICVCE
ncbi:MAG: hypothetical protein LUF34_01420 [Lachnospiraceae bacterium]|nr:hypothetical protein [Lachnospiraceae bacterium]